MHLKTLNNKLEPKQLKLRDTRKETNNSDKIDCLNQIKGRSLMN